MQQIGRYQILEEIARGGMGVVYRARDPASGRKVAIKVLLDPDPDPRFQQEARSSARLQHSGIVFLYDVGKDDQGRDFLVMELVEGESLQERLERDGPLRIDEAVGIALQLCEAMGHAHQRGVIHRDLKPHNVLITPEGVAKITDFGLGKVVDRVSLSRSRAAASLTTEGEVMGTPAYMPPEQAAGEKARVGPRSDVYSLGATLYALLAGRPPFKAETVLNLIYAVLDKPPEAPSTYRPDVPPWLDEVLLRCLAKEPADRYSDMERLGGALAGGADLAGPDRSTPARGRLLPLAAAVIVCVGLAGALALVMESKGAGHGSEAIAAFERGRQLAKSGQHEEAVAALSEAIRFDPGFADAFTRRGGERVSMGQHQAALSDFLEAIRLEPGSSRAYEGAGIARGNLGDFKGAVEDFSQAIRLEPGSAAAYRNRGVARMRLGDTDGMFEDTSMAIRLDSNNPGAYFNRISARQKRADWKGALEDAQELIRLEPERARGYRCRGLARANLDQLESAVRDFERVLEMDPTDTEARGILAGVRQELAEQRPVVEGPPRRPRARHRGQ